MKRILLILLLCSPAFGQFQQKPMLGEQIEWSKPISKGLVLYLPFNEGSGNTVFDLSGYGNTGTAVTAISWLAGPNGACVDFAGGDLNQAISLKNKIIFLSTDKWTLTFKIQNDGVHNEEIFIGENNTGDDRIALSDTGIVEFVNSSNTSSSFASLGFSPNWITYSLVSDGTGNLSLYVDGICKETLTGITTSFVLDSIGSAFSVDGYSFNGRCSFVYVHSRILVTSEIAELYAKPFCMFQQDVPLMAVEAPPAPGRGQVIMITSLFIGLYICRKYKAEVL